MASPFIFYNRWLFELCKPVSRIKDLVKFVMWSQEVLLKLRHRSNLGPTHVHFGSTHVEVINALGVP